MCIAVCGIASTPDERSGQPCSREAEESNQSLGTVIVGKRLTCRGAVVRFLSHSETGIPYIKSKLNGWIWVDAGEDGGSGTEPDKNNRRPQVRNIKHQTAPPVPINTAQNKERLVVKAALAIGDPLNYSVVVLVSLVHLSSFYP